MAEQKSLELWILVLIFIRNITDGCETYFITPTAWYYIKSLGGSEQFLAVVLASFNLTAVLVSPFIGFIADRCKNVKVLIVLTYVVKVVGNIIYSVNISPVFPLLGRIVSGIGESSFGIFMGQVALHTSEDDRAGTFVFLESAYCLGAAFGPALGSFLTFNANLFGWHINAGNSPGIILTFIWLVSLVGALFLPAGFGNKSGNEHVDFEKVTADTSDTDDSRTLTANERRMTEKKQKASLEYNSRILCLFYLIFSNAVFSSVATFYTPLLGLEVLHLKLVHVKLYFLNSSLMTLLLFAVIYIASHYFKERQMFLFPMTLQISAISLLIAIAFTWKQVSSIHYYLLLFYVSLGMPYLLFSTVISLLSKITDSRNASFYQGCSLAIFHLSIVATRLVASTVFTQTGLICFSLGLGLCWLVGAVWYALLYRSFKTTR